MASRRDAPPARRSWRQSPPRAASAERPASTRLPRFILAAATLGLLTAFVWLLMRPMQPEPTTYFVALLTGPSDYLSVPPILFEQPTVSPLAKLGESDHSLRFVDASSVQQLADAQAIDASLGRLNVQPDDRLIVYVSAHGVSDDGQAYVLGPSYDVRHPQQARYRVTDLLNAVARTPAATKLIVLDCSRLVTLPRLGMVVNEFPSLVEQAASHLNDPDLWIMTAAGELEASPLGLAERRSVLGAALVDGLKGNADDVQSGGNGDRHVSLAELKGFAERRCAASQVAAPQPRLLYGGPAGERVNLADRIVFRLPRRPATEKPPASAPPAEEPVNAASSQTATGHIPKSLVTLAAAERSVALQAGSRTEPAEPAGASGASSTPPAGAASPNASVQPAEPAGAAERPPEPPAPAPAVSEDTPPPKGGAPPPGAAPAKIPEGEKPPTAVDAATPPIIQVWRLRDSLSSGTDGAAPAPRPVDYAPHLWSTLNATLVSLHLEQLNPADPASPRTRETGELIAQCQQGLLELTEQRANGRGGLVTDRLAAAAIAYANSAEYQNLQALDRGYVDALFDRRRYAERAKQFVQWHAAMLSAVAGAESTLEAARRIRELLESLAQLDRELGEIDQLRPESWRSVAPQLRRIEDARRRVRQLASQLDEDLAAAVQSFTRGVNGADLRVAEGILTTEVGTADQRQAALTALKSPPAPTSSSSGAAAGWTGIIEHLRLEFLLMQLADPGMMETSQLQAIFDATGAWSAANEQQRLQLRAAGKEIQRFYADGPERVAQVRRSSSRFEDLRRAGDLLALMHPRDVSLLPASVDAALGFVQSSLQPLLEITLAAPSATRLSTQHWTPLVWTVGPTADLESEIQLTLGDFDDNTVNVRVPGSEELLRPGDVRVLRGVKTLRLEALARQEADVSGETPTLSIPLQARVRRQSTERAFDTRADVSLPRPNRIVMSVRCVEPDRPQPRQGDACLTLQPFPNRNTTFEFSLVNLSGEPKAVGVEVLSIPRPSASAVQGTEWGWPPGRLVDESGAIAQPVLQWAEGGMIDARTVAATEVALPAEPEPRRLELKPPAAPPPEAQPKEADGAAAPVQQPQPVAAIDATYGLVCRIVNREQAEESWIVWLEVAPLRPTSYIDFRGEVGQSREILIRATPSDSNQDGRPEFPPGIAEKPVSLAAYGDNSVFPAGSVVPAALGWGQAEALLSIQPLDSASGRPTLAVEVDGFPRAVTWRVDFDNQSMQQIRNPSAVRVERIAMVGADPTTSRLYRVAPYLSHPPIDPKQWPIVVDATAKVCAFDVSKGVRPLQLRLSADAPLDAFTAIGGGNAITLAWEGDGQAPVHLYDDRATRAHVVEVSKKGELTIAASVDDFDLTLAPPAVNDKAVWLAARESVQGAADHVDRVLVIFDGRPPAVSASLASQRVWEGTPAVSGTVDVRDISGVARLEAWITDKAPRKEADLDPGAAEVLSIPDALPVAGDPRDTRRIPFQLPAPTKPGQYFVTLRATDGSGQAAVTLDSPLSLAVVMRPPPVTGPVVADLKGRVLLGTRPAPAGLKVVLKESPAQAGATDAGGQFVIKNVKAGTYTIQISGRVGSGKVIGEQGVDLAEKADFEGRSIVKAELQLAEPPKQ